MPLLLLRRLIEVLLHGALRLARPVLLGEGSAIEGDVHLLLGRGARAADGVAGLALRNPLGGAAGVARTFGVGMIRASGYEPEVVEYMQTGWTMDQLKTLFAKAGIAPREALREKEARSLRPQLLDGADDDAILQAMVEEPVLVNRPIVVTPRGAALCRPSERVFDLLERRPEQFTKEDGEVV